jgi:hypothetical protein
MLECDFVIIDCKELSIDECALLLLPLYTIDGYDEN